ncbi:type IV toxin-antitoxin system AbiEi family antitoxin [Arthrobacter sp. GCM10027362]|uniref:type IV toxin-antitoxin system AbiEi family antitoxin n=1 Tax=Arthrobacter sp. GCM10027362 TaxID=3273379 RepID=UPI0036436CDD
MNAVPAVRDRAAGAGTVLVLQPGRVHTHNELRAMRLDGLVEHVFGPAYVAAGEPVTAGHRAQAARAALPEQIRGKVVIGRLTAAWVYGCAPPPQKVSVLLDHRFRTTSQGRCRTAAIHEVSLGPFDTAVVAGVPVTTAQRTALDIALHAPEEAAVPALLALSADRDLDCPLRYIRQALLAKSRLPGKRQALARIERVLGRLAGR